MAPHSATLPGAWIPVPLPPLPPRSTPLYRGQGTRTGGRGPYAGLMMPRTALFSARLIPAAPPHYCGRRSAPRPASERTRRPPFVRRVQGRADLLYLDTPMKVGKTTRPWSQVTSVILVRLFFPPPLVIWFGCCCCFINGLKCLGRPYLWPFLVNLAMKELAHALFV